MRSSHSCRRFHLLAAALFLWSAGPVGAHAQLRGLGGGGCGGTGTGGGAGVGGSGVALPGLPGSGPALPSSREGVTLGVTIPSTLGPPLPALPSDPVGTVANPGSIGNTLTGPLPNL